MNIFGRTITFENDNDHIVYVLDNIISFARNHQYFFVAAWVWWLSSIIGLQNGLIKYFDNLELTTEQFKQLPIPIGIEKRPSHPDGATQIETTIEDSSESAVKEPETLEGNTEEIILDDCEEFLRQSIRERKVTARRSLEISRGLSKKPIYKLKRTYHT
jgi:predicted solute-binding protein